MMLRRFRAAFLAAGMFLVANSWAATVLWDESIDGDADPYSPPSLNLANGDNLIRGRMSAAEWSYCEYDEETGEEICDAGGDYDDDIYILSLPSGSGISSVAITGWDAFYFDVMWEEGNVALSTPDANVFQDWVTQPTLPFSLWSGDMPLSTPGMYTLWLVGGSSPLDNFGIDVDYEMQITIGSAVPLPAAAWLIAPAFGLLAPWVKRRQSKA